MDFMTGKAWDRIRPRMSATDFKPMDIVQLACGSSIVITKLNPNRPANKYSGVLVNGGKEYIFGDKHKPVKVGVATADHPALKRLAIRQAEKAGRSRYEAGADLQGDRGGFSEKSVNDAAFEVAVFELVTKAYEKNSAAFASALESLRKVMEERGHHFAGITDLKTKQMAGRPDLKLTITDEAHTQRKPLFGRSDAGADWTEEQLASEMAVMRAEAMGS